MSDNFDSYRSFLSLENKEGLELEVCTVLLQWLDDDIFKIDFNNISKDYIGNTRFYTVVLKYFHMLRAYIIDLENFIKIRYKNLYEYYNGTASDSTLKELKYQPFRRTLTKTEVDKYIDGDSTYRQLIKVKDNYRLYVEILEIILKLLQNKNFVIKNMLDDNKLKLGTPF